MKRRHRKAKRGADGKFVRKDAEFYGTYVDDKGYIRICAGKFRGMRLHTLIGIAMKRRRLTKDEDVHHKDGDKLNPCPLCNLEVLGHDEHGYVSAAQHQFMLRKDAHELKIWQEIHGPISTPPERTTDDHCKSTDEASNEEGSAGARVS